jgi:DNA-binding transcriptional LysR family regulator
MNGAGQVWFVTGSSRGLGRAIVEAGLAAGNRVLATARDIKSLADLSERYGDQVKLYAMDVTDEAAAANAVTAAVGVFGSLSRQLRDLEEEIGAQLLTRTARGVALTPAGRAFLDHARGVLLQVDAAAEAARRAVHPVKPCFSMGFLTGHELTWMPEALRILRDELPNIDVMISSQYSPLLAEGLSKGKIDAAFLRKERALPDLEFRLLVKEPLVVILPSDHRLAPCAHSRGMVGQAPTSRVAPPRGAALSTTGRIAGLAARGAT